MKPLLIFFLLFSAAQAQTNEWLTNPADWRPVRDTSIEVRVKSINTINDSLITKIKSLVEYHSYAAGIISCIDENGKIIDSAAYFKFIRKFYERYPKNKKQWQD